MTDEQLIRWLRQERQSWDAADDELAARYGETADRLEALARRADEAERWCIVCTDQDGYRAGEAAGLAKALAVLRRVHRTLCEDYRHSGNPDHQERAFGVEDGHDAVARECGPATPPPHEATLARLRRLEAALEEVARRCAAFAHADAVAVERIARDALEQQP